jgi:hypothetical protein
MARAVEYADPIRSLAAELMVRLRADAPLYLFIVAYTVVGLAVLTVSGTQDRASYSIYLMRWVSLFCVLLPAIAIILHVTLLVHRFDKRRALAAKRIFSPANAAYFLSGIALIMAMVLFQGTFTSLKNAMSVWHQGFPLDRLHADIDAAVHFGVDPWRLLYAVAESDWVRIAVEWNYNVLWFVISFGALFFVATSPRAASIRTRYVLSFMLVWIVVGNVFASTFLSAGPAFYAHVTGDGARFGEQLAFLARGAASPNSAASYQSYLWSLHEAGLTGFGSGISAFPSVHVGLIALNAMFVCEYSRKLGVVAFGYVAFVLASSVYLAWHYAIDGYAAIGIALVIFLSSRRLLPNATPAKAAARLLPAEPAPRPLTAS